MSKYLRNRRKLLLPAIMFFFFCLSSWAEEPQGQPAPQPPQQAQPKQPSYAEVLNGARTIDGFIKLHQKGLKLFGEIAPGDLNKDMMVLISIARGIGKMPLVGGMTWDRDDDWIWQFRKVEDRLQIVRRNVRFRAARGTPQEKAVQLSYTDSILFSLPIITTGPNGSLVVDLTPVFISDLPQISQVLRGFRLAPERSFWSDLKGFKDNVELEVSATYASESVQPMDTVADSRGVTLLIHYSISRLRETGYQPRLADDRVGHFLTVIKDYSESGAEDRYVRYVNRWDLRKAEPSAALSPPVTPIIFWIEKTVPYKYRGAIREGILEWNKAFERIGFSNAIEVRQQPDDAAWDPEDINYNTFRWITVSAGFARGPSRVNPMTGQILDADIIFDADFLAIWQTIFDMSEKAPEKLSGVPDLYCDYAGGMAQQLALGSLALAAAAGGKAQAAEQLEKLLYEGVRSVAVHEVGHTLGLRHNFKASSWLSLDELSDPEKTRQYGLANSVMDYLPLNISPKGKRQGEYFSLVLGPYDYWAIEYAYKPLSGGTEGERAELAKIAARCTEPDLQYATDEDCAETGPDPLVNRYDLGSNPVDFARQRMELIRQLLPDLVEKTTDPGESYSKAWRAFGILMREQGRALSCVVRFIGGSYVHRDHKGDPNARPPLQLVEAKKQREALELLEQEVFGPEAFRLPPQLYNYLVPPHWLHWGMPDDLRPDLPVHAFTLSIQLNMLGQLLSPLRLSRLLDTELKQPAEQETFTVAELFQRLSAAIFNELDKLNEGKFTDRKPAIASTRRNLQRAYFQRLADLALGQSNAPADCQALAAVELEGLEKRIKQVLSGKAELDPYSRAHLSDLAARIRKVLEARLELKQP